MGMQLAHPQQTSTLWRLSPDLKLVQIPRRARLPFLRPELAVSLGAATLQLDGTRSTRLRMPRASRITAAWSDIGSSQDVSCLRVDRACHLGVFPVRDRAVLTRTEPRNAVQQRVLRQLA